MTLGNMWAFPSRTMSYDTTLGAMKALAERIARITGGVQGDRPSPRPRPRPRAGVPARRPRTCPASSTLDEPIPKLCTLVVASPFDAALHDAFGKVHGRNVYATYGPDLLPHDLVALPRPRVPRRAAATAFLLPSRSRAHPALPQRRRARSAGGARRREADRRRPARDAAGVDRATTASCASRSSSAARTCGWDVERTLRIDRVAAEAQARRGVKDWKYCLDFNERCPNVELRARLPAADPRGHARGLRAHPLRRAADRARPRAPTAATSCTRRRSCGRWSSTSR